MKQVKMIRENPQIKGLAVWIWKNVPYVLGDCSEECWKEQQDRYYDFSVNLLNKIQNNEFTSDDDHGD